MARRKIHAGSTSVSIPIFVGDTSSATGAGLGGLASNSAGLLGEYRRQGQASWTSITLAAGTLGTWSSGGWAADGGLAGAYEVGIPDAALASGARWAVVRYRGVTNMALVLIEVELDVVDYQSATSFVLGVNGMAPPIRWDQMAIDTGGRVAGNVVYVGGQPIQAPSSPAAVAGVLIVDVRYGNGLPASFPPIVPANVKQLNDSAGAAANLQAEAEAMHAATVTNETVPNTTQFSSSDAALVSQSIVYNTSRVAWRSGANAPRSFVISGCSGTTTKLFTTSSMPFAPVAGDKFVVLT